MNILRFVIPKSFVEHVYADSTIRQALEKMRFHRYAAIPVLNDEGVYIGTLRNDDLFKYFLDNGHFDTRAAERDCVLDIIEKSDIRPLSHNASMEQLIDVVKEHNFVSVVDDRGCFIGIILRRDVLNHLWKHYKKINPDK